MKPKDVLKPCPFCGGDSVTWQSLGDHTRACCVDCGAEVIRPMGLYRNAMIEWNTRPIEDALNARIAELEAENNRLAELLHNEKSQLEIATDLGNKRWVALGKIYKDGEKHNVNWCKRIAQEGLGIKNVQLF